MTPHERPLDSGPGLSRGPFARDGAPHEARGRPARPGDIGRRAGERALRLGFASLRASAEPVEARAQRVVVRLPAVAHHDPEQGRRPRRRIEGRRPWSPGLAQGAPHGSRLYRTVRGVLRQLGFGYFQLRVEGLQHIPREGGAILAGNHPNVLDGILLLIVCPRPVRFLVAEELFFHPLLHGFFVGMDCIPVYRTKTHNGEALREAVAALERGEVVGIFPEGTTSDLGRMRSIRKGVGLLALRTGVPVVPLGIWGSAAAYPIGTRVPRPRPVALVVAPPTVYPKTALDPIPVDRLQHVLNDIRWEILRAVRWAAAALRDAGGAEWTRPMRVALSSVVVLPLAGVLSLTANPSLDPGPTP